MEPRAAEIWVMARPKPAARGYLDAFGNHMGTMMTPSGMYGWRGQERSISDRDSGLVYMQSRHYDPTLGRFLQADALPLSGLTTQALKRQLEPGSRSLRVGRFAGSHSPVQSSRPRPLHSQRTGHPTSSLPDRFGGE